MLKSHRFKTEKWTRKKLNLSPHMQTAMKHYIYHEVVHSGMYVTFAFTIDKIGPEVVQIKDADGEYIDEYCANGFLLCAPHLCLK